MRKAIRLQVVTQPLRGLLTHGVTRGRHVLAGPLPGPVAQGATPGSHVLRWLLILLLGLLMGGVAKAELYAPMEAPFVEWVRNGEAVAQIVASPVPEGATRPEDFLNRYVEKITGTRLPLVDEPRGDGPVVYLGPKCGLDRLKEPPDVGAEGLVVQSVGRDMVIAGKSNIATLHAVAAFVEECLGVRWFWSHTTGEVIPRTETLRVGRVSIAQEPGFRYRWIGRGQWALFSRMNVGTAEPDEFRTKWFVHTFLRLVPPERYWDEHPEYYALRGGVRQDPREREKRVQLCTSNPEVAVAAAETIDEIMREDPDIDMISVDPEDSQDFCQCDECRALDEPGVSWQAKNSRRLVLFYNRVAELVAEKHPDLLLKSIAYLSYVAPPADEELKVHPNVVIQFCRFEGHDHPLFDETNRKNQEFNEHFLGWSRVAERVIFYEYYWKVSWLHLPWPIVNTLREEIPYLRDQALMGIATQYTTNFATHGLGYYVAAKLLWNPDLDVDALLEDFYSKAFGAAAPHMRGYYERLEKAVADSGVNLAGQRPYQEAVEMFTPQVMADLDAAMTAARGAELSDEERERVEFVGKGLAYTHLMADYLRAIGQVRAKVPSAKWYGGVSRALSDEAARVGGDRANAIRVFIEDPANAYAVGNMNNYLDSALRATSVVGAWREQLLRPDEIALTGPQWWARQGNAKPESIPAKMTLWVYGNDLDFVGGKPEHTISIRDAQGEETVLGQVADAEHPGDAISRAYVLPGVKREQLVDGKLTLATTNDPEGPYLSRFFAFYLMPEMAEADGEFATEKMESDLEWIRQRALGFVEYGFDGLRSDEGDAKLVIIETATE